MGSIRYCEEGKGLNMADAFKRLQDEAREEYGDDIYNGRINNAQGYRDVTNAYKSSKKDLDDFIDERCDNLSKFEMGEAICLDKPVENNNKVKSQVEHIVTKGTKKWILLYKVKASYRSDLDMYTKFFKTKGEAVTYARQMAEKFKQDFRITMIKELENGNPLVAKVSYKKSKNEKEGRYIFYGYVSY